MKHDKRNLGLQELKKRSIWVLIRVLDVFELFLLDFSEQPNSKNKKNYDIFYSYIIRLRFFALCSLQYATHLQK